VTIDFTDPGLDLVYLVSASYRLNGEDKTARWCGPPSRSGAGGMVAKDPGTGDVVQWESRLTGGRGDFDLGGLGEGVARVAALSFKVAAGGPDSLELRKAVRDGRWINRKAQVWKYDRSTGDSEHLGDGVVTREPTAWEDRGFSFALRVWPFPDSLPWPTGLAPTVATIALEWNSIPNPAVTPGNEWHPSSSSIDSFQINPSHFGKHLGVIFGGTTLQASGLFVELIPYGVQTSAQDFNFAWVSPQELCYVQNIWWESEDGAINPTVDLQNETIQTFVNRDPTRGPLGTCVKFTTADPATLDTQKPRWWGPETVPANMTAGEQHRVFAMVSGPGWADFPPTYDEQADPFLSTALPAPNNSPALTLPAALPPYRGWYDLILEDMNSAPWLNSFAPYLGASALADFIAAAPANIVPKYKCRVPYGIESDAPSMRAVLSEFMTCLQADLCWRLDPATDRLAMFPLWRGPRPGDVADWTFTDRDLVRVEEPRSIVWNEDPFRDYGTRVEVRTPKHAAEPADDIESRRSLLGKYSSPSEEAHDQYGGELLKKIPRKYWVNVGAVNARHVGEHHCQRQRASIATVGRLGYQVQLGDLVEYRIGDFPTTIGQVRRISLNLDAVTATITALHIEAFPSDGGDGKGEGK
jgi:hypothetical protein